MREAKTKENGDSLPRVLQAIAGSKQGGAEEFFTRLVPALARAGLPQATLIRPQSHRIDILRGAGIRTATAPFGSRFDVLTGFLFRRAIKRFAPDIVMTWMSRASDFCPVSKSLGLPFIHVARLGGYYNLKYYQHCDHLIGNTKDIVRYMVESGWPESRAHYLPNFVSAEKADPEPRARHYTPPGGQLLLALGRLHVNKGFDVLIRALADLPRAYLWIAGEGEERAVLEKLAVRCGVRPRVRFLGWVENVAPLYAAADILVCPSRHEPLGNVIIESWAHRVPVVAASSAGPQALIEDEKSGLLVPIEKPAALAKALERAMKSETLRKSLAAKGYKSFEAEFTEKVVAARYLEFFKKIRS